MPRYALIIEYDGTDFQGWQIQPNGPTVQEAIEQALGTFFRTSVSVTGSGRTDAGVHARFQVAHFDTESELNSDRLFKSLNGLLPNTIAVQNVISVDDAFHARFDAIKRTYRYYISKTPSALERRTRIWIPRSTDISRMQDAADYVLGSHDFSAFCRTKSETKNRVCSVASANWVAEGNDKYFFEITADRFLHGMVRALVGTMLQIGTGLHRPESIQSVLESRDRRMAGPAAKAAGLILHRVDYPDGGLPF